MNEIARIEPAQRLSISEAMASHYNMALEPFMATMRATVFAKGMSREEEAAFLLVARHHNLNPVTREIYAMPKRGGGIIPVVGIDGWVRMTNEHPAFDGMEFDIVDGEGKPAAMTCRIYRKDRSHPIAVTEYLDECKRPTDPWKEMPRRMLRHKAMIQCARYAFGFAGIYDPDEAERFAEPLGAGSQPVRRAPSPSPAPQIEPPRDPEPQHPAPQPARRAPSPSPAPQPQPQPKAAEAIQQDPHVPQHYDPEATRKRFDAALKAASDQDAINEAWMAHIDPIQDDMMPPDREDFERMVRLREAEIGGEEGAAP